MFEIITPNGVHMALPLPEGISREDVLAENEKVCFCGGAEYGYNCACRGCKACGLCSYTQTFPCKDAAKCLNS